MIDILNINDITISHASIEDIEELTQLYLDVYKKGYPLLLNSNDISEIISKQKDIWLVAKNNDNQIISAASSRKVDWNNSYETCRSVTRKEYSKNGIARKLYTKVLELTFEREDCDLIYGNPRMVAMLKAIDLPNYPIAITGMTNGLHIHSKKRENHLFDFVLNPNKKNNFIELINPNHNLLIQQLQKINLNFSTGKFPNRQIIGPECINHYEDGFGKLNYTFFKPSSNAQITNIDSDNPIRTINEFTTDFQAGFFYSYVLADKKEFINDLKKIGFEMSAYLPGWYKEDNNRFGCVMMTKRTDDKIPIAHGTQDYIKIFKEEYSIR